MIALKELSIRGDFRTTVEYLITLLETDTFQQNSIGKHTIRINTLYHLNLSFLPLILSLPCTNTLINTPSFPPTDTGWLDHLIAAQVKGKKPDTMLSVICAAVLIADNTIQDAYNNFYNSLEK